MKRLFLLTVCMFAFAAAVFAQGSGKTPGSGKAQGGIIGYKGEKGVSSIGGIVGYGIDNRTALAGLDYRYNIAARVRLAPSLLYAFENERRSVLYVNADVHYLARVTDKITIYPIGGMGVSVRTVETPLIPGEEGTLPDTPGTEDSETAEPGTEPGDAVTTDAETTVRMGLNLGFGGEMRVTKDIILGAEFRYNLTGERICNQAMLVARIAYYF